MGKKKVIAAGHICLDITPVFPGTGAEHLEDVLSPGKLVEVKEADVHTGGSVANTGLAMKILGADVTLTDEEIAYLPWGAKLMTLECGMRFLTDHLEGDVYFHTSRAGQNLDRCRTQCKLVADMEAHWDEMKSIVEKYR